MEEKNWFVLYTKPRWEKKIAGVLSSMGLESYCPLNRVERRWSDRRKLVAEPLFRCYVFVKVSQDEMFRPLEVNGVLNYIYWMKKPAPVKDHEIEKIKRFLTEHSEVALERLDVAVNEPVIIKYGPLMDKKGRVTQVREKYIKVAIRSLGYSLVATVNKSGVAKVPEPERQLGEYSEF